MRYRGPRSGLLNRRLAVVQMVAVVLFAPAYSWAFELKTDNPDLTVNYDSTLALGAQFRTQGRDPALIGIANGGTSRSVNEDDGDLNWSRGSLVSMPAIYNGELAVKYDNLDFFTRFYYLYDYAIKNKDNLGPTAEGQLGSTWQLLDLFGGGRWDTGGGRMFSGRVGRQVVNWGESTFIPNGINVINPFDVRRLRAPGSELRDAVLPVGMVWASQDIVRNVTVEGFYQFEWENTRLDPRGTYFSTNDFATPDGDFVFAGFGRRRDFNQPLVPPVGATAGVAQVWAPRSGDRDPSNGGQYGLALRIFAPSLNDTELGLYYANYHSRIPYVNAVRGTASTALASGTAAYFNEYPESIQLWGASFSTPGPWGVALQGEYSYRPNQPLSLAAPELLLAAVGLPNSITGRTAGLVPRGTVIQGFQRVVQQQLQMTATKAFGPSLGADQFALVGEIGGTYLDLPSGVFFNGPAVFLPAPGSANAANGSFQTTGFATRFSWGYRLLVRLDYPSAIGAATVSPRIGFAQDVNGVSPTFNEGAMALTFGVNFNLRQVWTADIAYTSYFGGRTISGVDPQAVPPGQSRSYSSSTNPLRDRDFLSVSVSYSF